MDGRTGVTLQHRENPRTIPPNPKREPRISPRVRRILFRRRAEEDYGILQPQKLDRRYAVGVKVIILAPYSKGAKLFNRWQGPGTVVEFKSPYSYIVEIDGKKKHVHANKIRKYNERIQDALVNNCAVIFERD